ncbi:hypothetical protein llap_9065 [Limosa lapponica baueri]|uniref:Uncharacterized protein n=1 Tax=Limosa lapponica baueri TaxID=1758121 RepID=A0A2I0U3H5_LIMLA|nr:hypothetical protein llap_9065 [Limosa lapponica baueri]
MNQQQTSANSYEKGKGKKEKEKRKRKKGKGKKERKNDRRGEGKKRKRRKERRKRDLTHTGVNMSFKTAEELVTGKTQSRGQFTPSSDQCLKYMVLFVSIGYSRGIDICLRLVIKIAEAII